MRATSFIAAAAAVLPAVNAAPVEARQNDIQWSVSNWSAGCARSGCYYNFNIAAEAHTGSPAAPAFSASCTGKGEGADFAACTIQDVDGAADRHVSARLEAVNTTGTGAHITVSYQFADQTQANTYWNLTAHATSSYNQFVSPNLDFTMTVSEIIGIA